MEFVDKPLEPFGDMILDMAVPTELSYKMPLVFRIVKELVGHHCLPEGGDPRVELALDEALANCMIHGNGLDKDKKVKVRVFTDDERWGVLMEDEGEGFGPDDVPDETNAELLFEEAGRGIILIDSIMDQLLYGPGGAGVMLIRKCSTERDAALAASDTAAREQAAMDRAAETVPEGGPGRMEMAGEVAVLEFMETRLSGHNIAEARDSVDEVIELSNKVVFDLGRVDYVSSIVIGLFVSANKRLAARDGHLVLAGVQPVVMEVLSAVKLDRLIKMAASRAEAVALLSN